MSNLANNIKEYRKINNMTQEQLADKLDVKFGTVSKWERGSSEPDIDYIMALADVFHISVDTLIGYSMKGKNVDGILEKIGEHIKNREFAQAVDEADSGVLKFPNNIKIVHTAAKVYLVAWSEEKVDNLLEKAYKNLNHSLELLPSDDPEINEILIKNEIATCLTLMGKADKAYKMHVANNVMGINENKIAFYLAENSRNYEEAENHADKAFLRNTSEIVSNLLVYLLIFYKTDKKMCMKTCDFFEAFINLLRDGDDCMNAFDKYIPICFLVKGICLADGNIEQGKALIKKAYETASQYDNCHGKNMENVIFARTIKDWAIFDSFDSDAQTTLNLLLDKYLSENKKEKIYEYIEGIQTRKK